MTPLPILLSVPHAGLVIPDYLESYCLLDVEAIVADGDVGAAEIYDIADEVAAFVSTKVARAVVDMNRALDDIRKDGIIKTHTCWDVPIWHADTPPELLQRVIPEFHGPYHSQLTKHAGDDGLVLGVDGHTMAEYGPPVGPDPGAERPLMCLGDGDGACPRDWVSRLRDLLAEEVGGAGEVTINQPFSGGWITRSHGKEMPWVQLEVSRTARLTAAEKRSAIRAALTRWCEEHTG